MPRDRGRARRTWRGTPALAGALMMLLGAGRIGAAARVTRDLVIVSVSDRHGVLTPCGCRIPRGGLARQAFLTDSLRGRFESVLVLENGAFLPAPAPGVAAHEASLRTAADVIEWLPRAGVQAANVGGADLAFGLAPLRERSRAAGLPLVSANLVERATSRPAVAPHLVIEAGRRRVGVFGVLGPDADLGPASDSLRVDDPVASARAAVRALRAEHVDAIVVLSQLGRAGGEALAREVEGIDVLIAGRDVPLLPEGRTFGRATAAYAGDRGYAVGLSTLTFDPFGRILAARSRSMMLGPEVRDRTDIAAGIARTNTPDPASRAVGEVRPESAAR